MKEAVVGMILMFGATAGVFAFLGGGENRNIGFRNWFNIRHKCAGFRQSGMGSGI